MKAFTAAFSSAGVPTMAAYSVPHVPLAGQAGCGGLAWPPRAFSLPRRRSGARRSGLSLGSHQAGARGCTALNQRKGAG